MGPAATRRAFPEVRDHFIAQLTDAKQLATRRNDLLSLHMFQHDYLSRLLQIGEADGEGRLEDVTAFLQGEPSAAPAGG